LEGRTPKKNVLSFLEEIGRAQNKKLRRKLFVGRAGFRHGGGAVSLVPFKVGSSKVQNFPHFRNIKTIPLRRD